jgi:SWI/SNF-related matrix-associated actin-dependent regulator of chromatin subfamily A containing DEAD/H box 1
MIDILGEILKEQRIGYLVLTGSTPINGRQSIVDEFTMDKKMKLPVFLLSTKAGGLGINLTAASVVIM